MQFFTTSQNLKVPKLIYGTAWKKDKTADLTLKAIMYGFRGIDTACQPKHYHEKGIGEALEQLKLKGIKREELFLQTKFTPYNGQDPHNVPYDPKEPLEKQIIQSFKTSQSNLKTEYIDSLILHSPFPQFDQTYLAWQTMETLYQKGLVRHLGISNCYELKTLQDLFVKSTIKPSFLQNRFYAQTNYDKKIRKWCNQNKIIYQSFWTLTANPHLLESPSMFALTKKYKMSSAQIFFRYLTQRGILPLTGPCSEIHMQEDLKIFEIELDEADLKSLEIF